MKCTPIRPQGGILIRMKGCNGCGIVRKVFKEIPSDINKQDDKSQKLNIIG